MRRFIRHTFNYNTKFVMSVLLLALLYYSYRYIFQYNSEGTSPTYTNTPELFKIGKYILLIFIYFYFIIAGGGKKQKESSNYGYEVLCLIVTFDFVLFLRALLFQDVEMVKLLSVGILPLFYYWQYRGSRVDILKISNILYWFFLFSIIYEFTQFLLFFSIGRLPALAYNNSISVRFGGPWDDPNGWGISLSFFIPFVYYYKKKSRWRYSLIVIGMVMLIATQSLTAIGSCFLSWSFLQFIVNRSKRPVYVMSLILLLIISYTSYRLVLSNSFVLDYIEMKQGSVYGHAKSLNIFSSFEWFHYIIGYPENIFNESDIANILCFGGVLLLIVYMSIIFFTISGVIKLIRKNVEFLFFWKSTLAFLIAYLIASINLPCTKMFYLFVMFNVIVCLTFWGRYSLRKILLLSKIKLLIR